MPLKLLECQVTRTHVPRQVLALSAAAQAVPWLGRSSTSMVLELPLFNAEWGSYGLARFRLILDRAGRVEPVLRLTTLPRISDASEMAMLRFAAVGLLTLLFVEEGWELVISVHHAKRFKYCTSGWTVLDWAVILLGVYLFAEFSFYRVEQAAAEDNLLGDAALPASKVDIGINPIVALEKQLLNTIENLV